MQLLPAVFFYTDGVMGVEWLRPGWVYFMTRNINPVFLIEHLILPNAINHYKKYNSSCHKMSDIGICSNSICQFESGLLNRMQYLSILLHQRTVHIIIYTFGIFYNSFKSSWLSKVERCHLPVMCETLHVWVPVPNPYFFNIVYLVLNKFAVTPNH